jgi:DNA/RNA endonuclease G (NUC1)
LADYKGSGFDRGHMAPAGNQTTNAKLKEETFFLSNMTPQVPALNQQIWRELEDKTRQWVEQFGATHQITGVLFYDPKEENPQTADGIIHYSVIGKGQVAVPTHLFKIIIAQSGGQTKAIAFVIENRKHSRPFQFEQFIKSINWIEERTGLDFMPEMNLQEQRRLERDPSPLWQ